MKRDFPKTSEGVIATPYEIAAQNLRSDQINWYDFCEVLTVLSQTDAQVPETLLTRISGLNDLIEKNKAGIISREALEVHGKYFIAGTETGKRIDEAKDLANAFFNQNRLSLEDYKVQSSRIAALQKLMAARLQEALGRVFTDKGLVLADRYGKPVTAETPCTARWDLDENGVSTVVTDPRGVAILEAMKQQAVSAAQAPEVQTLEI